MISNNPNSIIIVGRKDATPEPITDEALQQMVEESAPEVSGAKRMLAVILLMVMGAGLGGIIGLIAYVAQ